jgi:hypothetical protein
LAVRVSTSVLPAGQVRDRYRQELVAELFELDRSRQLHFAAGVLSRAWLLRRAITEEDTMGVEHAHTKRVPLHCRLHLHHHYRQASTADGQVYTQCEDCGQIKANYVDPEGPGLISRGLPMGIG